MNRLDVVPRLPRSSVVLTGVVEYEHVGRTVLIQDDSSGDGGVEEEGVKGVEGVEGVGVSDVRKDGDARKGSVQRKAVRTGTGTGSFTYTGTDTDVGKSRYDPFNQEGRCGVFRLLYSSSLFSFFSSSSPPLLLLSSPSPPLFLSSFHRMSLTTHPHTLQPLPPPPAPRHPYKPP